MIQSLEGLGAGFQLASHDLDIRGAGNLLGDEQSGQIREVGFELYNHMLEEAVAELRARQAGEPAEAAPSEWTPQITIDAAALMPGELHRRPRPAPRHVPPPRRPRRRPRSWRRSPPS